MAAKPQMTVRLAPSILHALIYIAEREGTTPAELARSMITAAAHTVLDHHGWRADCQDAYMRWLAERRADDRDESAGDIELDGGIDLLDEDLAAPSAIVEPAAPRGLQATLAPLFDYSEVPPKALSAMVADADRLLAQHRPDGRKRRS